ncbi:secretion/DNA translocation related TadE-like protein [Nocardiopsis mwathae]|uniref:Secretion/DNA translocation related TadE-like protein n=1 Tax=Nocardiopsis mwathae TaxID=1472723 RepID=A0A7W9YL29_9ACTN|nr:Rv3654c family TadE-like protein [Nocardiopsis mwathae]MBB6174160.1 secretion/DNA translocation related TadE-like protein [Nocardiopsis mwathae]
MRATSTFRPADLGSATVWVLALGAVIWFSAFTAVLVASVRIDRHRAATAADLAALAGAAQSAHGPRRACAVADATAAANGARLVGCTLRGLILHVEVEIPARMWPGAVPARARAGPVSAP